MSNGKHIFISYARKDGFTFADKLRKDLLPQHTVWMDVYSIPDGSDWTSEIQKALETALCVLSVMTPEAANSAQVKSELLHTIDKKIPVIPLIAIPCEIPYFLKVYNHIDFTGEASYEIQLERLSVRINQLEGRAAPFVDEDINKERERVSEEAKQKPPDSGVRIAGMRVSSSPDHFKDRKDQLRELSQRLAQPATRVMSIIGPGGRGKTALASKLLADLEQNQWSHLQEDNLAEQPQPITGIIYLDGTQEDKLGLANIYEACIEIADSEASEILKNVWQSPISIEKKIERLLDFLGQGIYIILLDNLEDSLLKQPVFLDTGGNLRDPDLAQFFAMSLRAPRSARLLITSRDPVLFSPNDQAHDYQIGLNRGLPPDDAIAMLHALDPNGFYGLHLAENQQYLDDIVRKVEGDPRALEVFAGIVKDNRLKPLSQIVNDFFTFEVTTRSLIENGYKRLDENARRVMEALAVLEKPVPVIAVEYVLQPFVAKIDVEAIIARLIHIHMVDLVDRQRILITLNPVDRAYIYSQLPEGDDDEGDAA